MLFKTSVVHHDGIAIMMAKIAIPSRNSEKKIIFKIIEENNNLLDIYSP